MGKPIALQIKEAIVSYWERNKEKNGGSGPTLSSLEEIFGVKRNTVFRILKNIKILVQWQISQREFVKGTSQLDKKGRSS